MKNLHELYRLFELNRLVYMVRRDAPSTKPEAEEAAKESAQDTQAKDAASQNHESQIDTHKQSCHQHVGSVVKAYKNEDREKAANKYAETVRGHIGSRFQALENEYKEAKDEALKAKNINEQEKEALDAINQKAEDLARGIQEKNTKEHQLCSVKNETTTVDRVEPKAAEATETDATDEEANDSKEVSKEEAKQVFIKSLYENRDLRFTILRTIGSKADPESISQEDFAKEVNTGQFVLALNEFAANLTREDLTKLQNGELTLTPKHRENIQKAITKAFDIIDKNDKLPNAQEVQWIMEFQLEGKDGKNKDRISFGQKYGKHAAEIISMDFELRMEGDELQYKKGEEFVPVIEHELINSIENRITKNDDGEELKISIEKDPEKWKKKAEAINEAMKHAIQLRDTFAEGNEASERMGIMEYITAAMQIYAMFKEAIESGDPEALNALSDAMNDFGKGENPAKKMTEAREKYGDEIGKINDIESLLKMYGSPTGPEANRVFGSGNVKVPYRLFLKDAIKGQLESSLKVEITNMESLSGGKNNSKINCTRNGESYQIYLYEDSGRVTARVKKTGSEAVAEEKAVEELAGDENNSLESLFNSFVASSAKAPEKPEETKKEKEENEEGEEAETESEEEEAAEKGTEENEDTKEAEEEE